LKHRPEESDEFARDGYGDLWCGLVMFRQASKSPTPSLLRFISDRDHPPRLAFPSSRERHPNARSVFVVPRRFNQPPADQGIARPRNAPASLMLTRRILARH
jgi:hypothetical protein